MPALVPFLDQEDLVYLIKCTQMDLTPSQTLIFHWSMLRSGLSKTISVPASATSLSDRRASILDTCGALNGLGVGNVAEPEAQFIEPAHCLTEDEFERALPQLAAVFDVAAMKRLQLTVLDPELVAQYQASMAVEVGQGMSNASAIRDRFTAKSPVVLFDPLYGMALVDVEGRWRQFCFSDMLWKSRIQGMPPHLIKRHLERTIDSLSEGVALAKGTIAAVLTPEQRVGLTQGIPPEIVVHTPAELSATLDRLQDTLTASGVPLRMWFRGQTKDYLVPDRSELVASGIARYCSVRDTSLVPSLYRVLDSHHTSPQAFARLARHVGDWILNARVQLPDGITILDAQGKAPYTPKPITERATARATLFMAGKPHLDIPGLKDLGPYSLFEVTDADGNLIDSYIKLHHPSLQGYRTTLPLQHYGCPTAWIDITHDRQIALWFALNRLSRSGDGQYVAERINATGDDPSTWPTIYLFLLHPKVHPVIDSSVILSKSKFLRPQVQKCGLLGEAGSLSRNYAARFIAVKVRLGKGFEKAALPSAREVFPPAEEDQGLAELLRLEANDTNDKIFRVYTVVDA